MQLEIGVQIVEIYNETFRDLLSQDGGHEPPRLKLSTIASSPALPGAAFRMIPANAVGGAGLQEILRYGQAQRATSATSVHGRSSRSHLVMTLFLALVDSQTRALRRKLTPAQQKKVTKRVKTRTSNFPQRRFAVAA